MAPAQDVPPLATERSESQSGQAGEKDLTKGELSRFSPSTVHVIAQSVPHLPPLRDDAAAALAPDAEYRIREIVQDAIKFMRHAKRGRLSTRDIDSALRLRNVEPLYGFGPAQTRAHDKRALSKANGGDTLRMHPQVREDDAASTAAEPEVADFTLVDGTADLYFVEDSQVNLKDLIESSFSPLPLDVTISAHWLAVDGNQPAIPQNPLLKAPRSGSSGAATSQSNMSPGAAGLNSPLVKPKVQHVLSRELQLYFDHVTKTLVDGDERQQSACLTSLGEDPGLGQLLPYLTLHVREQVQKSLKQLPKLFMMMRVAKCLLTNPHFEVETYLHQMLPAILSCLVSKRLCQRPRENHWALRNYAAQLVKDICVRFGARYSTLQPRITKTLNAALRDPSKPLTTHYGAVIGLAVLGKHVIDLLIAPLATKYSETLVQILEETLAKPKSVRRLEAAKVYGALVWAASVSVLDDTDPELSGAREAIDKASPDKLDALVRNGSTMLPKLMAEYGDSLLLPFSATEKAGAIATELGRDAAARENGTASST